MDKLSYLVSKNDLTGEYSTIPEALERQAREQPDKEAFIIYKRGERTSITFKDLYKKCLRFASSLMRVGIQKGDVVLLDLENCIEWLIIEFGLIIIGAVPLNTFALSNDATDRQYLMSKSEAVGICTTIKSFRTASGLEDLICSENFPFLKHAIAIDIPGDTDNVLSFWKLLNSEVTDFDRTRIYIDPDDIAVIMRTSGTTGRPKLAAHSHRSVIRCMMSYTRRVVFTNDIKFFTNSGFGWILGSPCAELVGGWSRISVASGETTDTVLKYIEKEKCNVAHFTSDLLNIILNRGTGIWPSALEVLVHGGSPVKTKIAKTLEHFKYILSLYGSNEMGMVTAEKLSNYADVEENIAGNPCPGTEIKVTDDERKLVKRGIKGRIFVRGNYRFLRYYNDPSITKQMISPENWFDSQDVGFISQSGKLYVLGRSQEQITRGAVTVHSSEIETMVKELQIPQIEEVAAIPIPDDIYGQEICVCIIRKPGVDITQNELRRIINDKIIFEAYTPKYIVFFDAFQFTSTGKLRRGTLIQQAKTILFPR